MESLGTNTSKLKSAILVSCDFLFFWLSALAHTMKAGRSIYSCVHVSFTTVGSARSKNWYKTPGKTKPESEIVISLFSFGKRIWWFPLAFSRCVAQGKLKFLLSFGFIVSLLSFLCTHWNSACVSQTAGPGEVIQNASCQHVQTLSLLS